MNKLDDSILTNQAPVVVRGAENRSTAAKSIGLGLQVQGFDKYFFDKSISGRVEYSKNWGTGKLEDLSDVRLNKQHLLVSLAMNF